MGKIFAIIASLLSLCINGYCQQKLDFKTLKNKSAIVVYKFGFDSVGKSATLIATNIYCNKRYYPVANKGVAISSLENTVIKNEPTLVKKSRELIAILDSVPAPNLIDFIDCPLFADSTFKNEDANYFYGGEQFIRPEQLTGSTKYPVRYFYVAFRFNADLLFVSEGAKKPYYMREWACPDSYKYTNGSSDPTFFLLKLHNTYKLSSKEQKELHLTRIDKFGYSFYYCD